VALLPTAGPAHDEPRLGRGGAVQAEAVTPAQLKQALRELSSWGGRLGQNLVALGFIDEAVLAQAVAAWRSWR
jgi:hypothetical protein